MKNRKITEWKLKKPPIGLQQELMEPKDYNSILNLLARGASKSNESPIELGMGDRLMCEYVT